jgi:hypothetical protein
MSSLDLIFAWIIAVLAGLSCIGALAVVLVAEWYAIRRTIQRHRATRPPADPMGRWWRERSALTAPERRS